MISRSPIPSRPISLTVVCGALAAALFAAPVGAKNLGVRGQTWAIAEPDLLTQIEARLSDMERSGEFARLEQGARSRTRARIEAPERIDGIAPARQRRTRLFDPTVTVERDIITTDGTMIAAAGTRIDPFAHSPLSRDLLFIDGTRAVEVDWALAHERPAKIILIAGRPLDLARIHGRPFFFDQSGTLTARFALRATPSLVRREGTHLRITEIPLDDEHAEFGQDGAVKHGVGKQ